MTATVRIYPKVRRRFLYRLPFLWRFVKIEVWCENEKVSETKVGSLSHGR
jgi:hypothetical protein